MDYSHGYFGGAQPYQFMGIAPLTPSHSNSVASDDFTTTSPPEGFDQFPSGLPHDHQQFQAFENFAPQYSAQQFPSPPQPPTPPNQLNGHSQPPSQQHQVQQIPAPQAQLQAAQPVALQDGLPLTKEETEDQANRQGSNSDDEDLTPAQSRRKAQNRAAQRAFRERKERHVKDLEAKLASLEAMNMDTATENERLKRDLQKISTENEILRATSSIQQANGVANGAGGQAHSHAITLPNTTGPMSYNPTEFYSEVLANHANKTPSHRIVQSENGERLLAAGATWEYIISHDLFKKGLVDVGDVSLRLKHLAKCDGQGPVFEERAINEAIEQSVASGSDELL